MTSIWQREREERKKRERERREKEKRERTREGEIFEKEGKRDRKIFAARGTDNIDQLLSLFFSVKRCRCFSVYVKNHFIHTNFFHSIPFDEPR